MISTGWRRTPRCAGLCRRRRRTGESRQERRAETRRWRRRRSRALPSPDAAGRWLGVHDGGEEARRQAGRAFIRASSEGAAGLGG
jgi:hypothetical protein